jgi:alpha-tubulin suppressor-like RCC1 family protein
MYRPFLAYFLVLKSGTMTSLRASWPAVLKKLLIAGAGLCAASAAVVIGSGPAHGSTGGAVEYWGGTSSTSRHLTPVTLRLPAPVAEVGSSDSADYALLDNGTVYAWGLGTNGQLGDGSTADSVNTPVQVRFPAGVRIASIPGDAVPYNSGFAVDTTGHVWAWGANKGGEFCLGNTRQYNTPVELPFANVTALAGAGGHSIFDADGTLYSCGNNQYGQLGDGHPEYSMTPVKVTGLGGQLVTSLVASWCNTGALLSDGQYYDWGYNAAGQLGDGTIGTSAFAPVRVSLPDAVTQATLGGSLPSNGQTLVLLSDGSLYAWGNDSDYQLGDGRTASEIFPERIQPPAGVTYRTLATGGSTSYAISTTGNVYAWGGNTVGEVGDGSTTTAERPVRVEFGATAISSTAGDVVASVG